MIRWLLEAVLGDFAVIEDQASELWHSYGDCCCEEPCEEERT